MIQFVIKKVKELNKSKLPVVRIDNSLEKYKDKVLFKDKLDKANEMQKTLRGRSNCQLVFFIQNIIDHCHARGKIRYLEGLMIA